MLDGPDRFDLVGDAALIGAGFGRTPDDIGKLTSRQISLFFAEVQALQRANRRAFISDANAAYAGGKSAKQQLKELE